MYFVQLLSHVWLFETPWTAALQASLSFTNSQNLLKLMSIKYPWYHPIILSSVAPFSCLQSFPASVFSNELALCIRWPKYWNFSLSPSSEYSGLISIRTGWFDVLAVQGTLKSLLQHHRLKASVLQHSAFFMVQLSHPYMIIGKTIALTRWTFGGKMSLLLNALFRLVIAFLPRSKGLLISWLQSPFAMQETWVLFQGQEDPQEKRMVTHSSILGWWIPWTEEPGGLQSMGSQTEATEWLTHTSHAFSSPEAYCSPMLLHGK